ncbi:MAG: helix-turn-helix domain-containing protein [Endomicrobiales bacterium]|jgi:transposase
MPQAQLPLFPEGITHITHELGFIKKDGRIVYFNGHLPVFMHAESDIKTFKMITSQFIATGLVKQKEISRIFGIPIITVKRAVKTYREKGPGGFYESRRGKKTAKVLTPELLEEAQDLLDEGLELGYVGGILGVKTNTLNKAVHKGKLRRTLKKKSPRKN